MNEVSIKEPAKWYRTIAKRIQVASFKVLGDCYLLKISKVSDHMQQLM